MLYTGSAAVGPATGSAAVPAAAAARMLWQSLWGLVRAAWSRKCPATLRESKSKQQIAGMVQPHGSGVAAAGGSSVLGGMAAVKLPCRDP